MLRDVVWAAPLSNYHLQIRFDDGVTGEVNISEIIEFTGVFEPLSDETYFRLVKVNPELGVLYWPNGADIDSDVLYSQVTGVPLPNRIAA